MSDQGGTTGYVPPPGGYAPVPSSGGRPPAPPLPPYGVTTRPNGRGGRILVGAGVALAIVLAAAALVVALVAHDNKAAPPSGAASTRSSTEPQSTETADRALCQAIAPLMKEGDARAKAFVNLGQSGTPERDAGIAQFVADTQSWADRVQKVLDQHKDPPRFLTRTLQRYIDDVRLYAVNIRPGPATEFDTAAWNDSVVAYGGPVGVCPTLGVQWW
jgi:hypothetical protein